jgi:hypothetical protein
LSGFVWEEMDTERIPEMMLGTDRRWSRSIKTSLPSSPSLERMLAEKSILIASL